MEGECRYALVYKHYSISWHWYSMIQKEQARKLLLFLITNTVGTGTAIIQKEHHIQLFLLNAVGWPSLEMQHQYNKLIRFPVWVKKKPIWHSHQVNILPLEKWTSLYLYSTCKI